MAIFQRIQNKITVTIKANNGIKKYFFNASWLLSERIFFLIISMLIGVWVARYLGPTNFGTLNFAISFAGIFGAFASLGVDSILVKELVLTPEKKHILLGTSLVLKLLGALGVLLLLAIGILFVNTTHTENKYLFIVSVSYIFQASNIVDCYIQSIIKAKRTVIVRTIQNIVSIAVRILFVHLKLPLVYFVYLVLFDAIALCIGMFFVGRTERIGYLSWRYNIPLMKFILRKSLPLMLTGVAITIYMRIDQVMVKTMLGNNATGQYAVAVRIAEAWYFVPMALISTLFPAVVKAKSLGELIFIKRLQQFHDLMTSIGLLFAVFISIFSHFIIRILFGVAYQESANILTIYTWAGVFVCVGTVNSQVLVVENKEKQYFFRTALGAIANIILNLILIPQVGIAGAAIATVLSYAISGLFSMLLFKGQKRAFLIAIKSFFVFRLLLPHRGQLNILKNKQ